MKQCPKCDGEMIGRGKKAIIVIKLRIARIFLLLGTITAILFNWIYLDSKLFYLNLIFFGLLFLTEIVFSLRDGKNGYECVTCGYFITSKPKKDHSKEYISLNLIHELLSQKCSSCGSKKLLPSDKTIRIKINLGTPIEELENRRLICQDCGAETVFNPKPINKNPLVN